MNRQRNNSKRDLTHVGDLVDEVIADLGKRAGVGAGAALAVEWRSVAGPEWEAAQPMGIDGGTLVVVVPDGRAATRLSYARRSLLERIEARFGSGTVSAIRIRVARK